MRKLFNYSINKMLNKKIGLKTALFIGLVAGLGSSFVSAASFSVNLSGMMIQALDSEDIEKNMTSVHFVDHGNDFGGFIYWSSIDKLEDNEDIVSIGNNITGELVSLGDNPGGYVCRQQVKGFYYDSQRGERLFPIDKETAVRWQGLQPGLATDGGIYTDCTNLQLEDALNGCLAELGETENAGDGEGNPDGEGEDENLNLNVEGIEQCQADARALYGSYGYYGMVEHEYDGKNFGLIIGTKYQVGGDTDWVSVDESLADTLIRYNNQYPVGFVYDYHGGIGFLGCRFMASGSDKTSDLHALIGLLNSGSRLQDLFRIGTNDEGENILFYSGYEISLDCSDISKVDLIQLIIEGLIGMGKNSNLNIIGNQTNPKMQFFKSDYVDNTDLINYAKKKGESLCRGKWISYDDRYNILRGHVFGVLSSAALSSQSALAFNSDKWKDWYEEIAFAFYNDRDFKTWWEAQYDYWKTNGGHLYCIDLSEETDRSRKTIFAEPGYTYVVKGGNVLVTPMRDTFDDNYNYDIYILENGNLVLDDAGIQYERIFTKDGFIAFEDQYGNGSFKQPRKTYQNDIENNGLGNYNGNYAAFGAFIKGNFVINGHLIHACDVDVLELNCPEGTNHIGNRYFVYGKFTTKDSLEELKNLFSWRCTNGLSSDITFEKYCPQKNNNYKNAFMVVIDQDYDSPLF